METFLDSLSCEDIRHKTTLLERMKKMLRDLEDQLEKVAISGEEEEVTDQTLSDELLKDLLMTVKHPTFVSFFADEKNFEFSFDHLDNLIQDDDPMYLKVLQILYLLPKDDVTSQRFQTCMLHNVNYFYSNSDIQLPEHQWVLETGYEFRVKLAYFYIPRPKNVGQLTLEINREDLVGDSITKIMGARVKDLEGGISIRFLDEEGIGDGVRRDWLISLVGKMVQTQGAFQTTGDDLAWDNTRIYAKHGSSEDADFYRCFGRLIVLALIHNIQVGFTLDNVLFLQLADKEITLEDIKATAPRTYNGYHKIFRLSPSELLQTPVYFSDTSDYDEPTLDDDDETIGQVNVENRERYVAKKIHKEFVGSIETQTDKIIEGFDDLLSVFRIDLFQILKLEDLDYMIRGIKELKIEDWIKFTTYDRCEANDPQIEWFWQCVTDLSEEKRRKLLYIWTGIKYLPRGGFEALRPPIVIRNWPQDEESRDDLPRAQTCFHTLSFPQYESYEKMLEKLHFVIDECDGTFRLE